jgi:hypothetical protein
MINIHCVKNVYRIIKSEMSIRMIVSYLIKGDAHVYRMCLSVYEREIKDSLYLYTSLIKLNQRRICFYD